MSSIEEVDLKALIKKCVEEDRAAQKQLYMRYYSYGMGICLRYVKDNSEAISCLNDSFLKVFDNMEKFDLTRDFKPWLKTILINTLLNHLRKNDKLSKNVDLDKALEIGLNEEIISNIQYTDLLKLVQQLSNNYRTVFNMYVIDGYNHEEIANRLNINVSTSRSNLTRAKVRLRQLLGQLSTMEYEK